MFLRVLLQLSQLIKIIPIARNERDMQGRVAVIYGLTLLPALVSCIEDQVITKPSHVITIYGQEDQPSGMGITQPSLYQLLKSLSHVA